MSSPDAPDLPPFGHPGGGPVHLPPADPWPTPAHQPYEYRGDPGAHRAPVDDRPPRHLHAVPPPATQAPEPAPPPYAEFQPPPASDPAQQAAAADLRNQVVLRLRKMNALHALHAWERRYRDPLCPYGLAFFYYEPEASPQGQPRYLLRTGTRLFLAADAPESLPRLLYELARQAFELRQRGRDPYPMMTDRRDDMSGAARYLGLGVSSLDSRWASWANIQRTARGVTEVPGRGIAYLSDGTSVVFDRGALEQFDEFEVRSTHNLTVGLQHVTFRWRFASSVDGLVDARDTLGQQMIHDVLRRLADLHRAMGGSV